MPLILARSATFKWKFKLREIDEDGEVVESDMKLIVRRVEDDEFQELLKLPHADMLKKVVVGWPSGEVRDADGSVEYSPENLASVIADPARARQITQEYVRINIAIPEKN